MKNLQGNSIIEISGGQDLIPIVPAGVIETADGRGPYNMKDAAAVIAASKRKHVALVIDRDHATDLAAPGTPIKAAGWMELVEKDGAVMAKVEWTPLAKQELADREYRYISPTFMHKKDGTITKILRATLTNTPNFDMKAVASARAAADVPDDNPEEEENDNMNKHLLALAAMAGLTATTIATFKTDEELATAAEKRIKELFEEETALASIRTGLREKMELDEKADDKEILATAATLKSKPASKDGDFVPMDQFKATASALKQLQTDIAEQKATAAVEKAMGEGKIIPVQKDWALALAKSDPEKFDAFAKTAAVIVKPGETNLGERPADHAAALNDEEKAVAQQLGIAEDEFKKAR